MLLNTKQNKQRTNKNPRYSELASQRAQIEGGKKAN